jgi:hypothetical protein
LAAFSELPAFSHASAGNACWNMSRDYSGLKFKMTASCFEIADKAACSGGCLNLKPKYAIYDADICVAQTTDGGWVTYGNFKMDLQSLFTSGSHLVGDSFVADSFSEDEETVSAQAVVVHEEVFRDWINGYSERRPYKAKWVYNKNTKKFNYTLEPNKLLRLRNRYSFSLQCHLVNVK